MLFNINSEPKKSSTYALRGDFITICFVSQELISKSFQNSTKSMDFNSELIRFTIKLYYSRCAVVSRIFPICLLVSMSACAFEASSRGKVESIKTLIFLEESRGQT